MHFVVFVVVVRISIGTLEASNIDPGLSFF